MCTKLLNRAKSGKPEFDVLRCHKHDLYVGFPDNIKLNQGHDPASAQ